MDHNKLWEIFKEIGIPDHLTCFLRNLLASQEVTVRTILGTTDWFKIGKGVWQNYIFSASLFNLCAEYIIWNARLNEAQPGIKTAGRNINNLRYADDTTLMAESDLLMRVREESEKAGLKTNIQKTKITASSPITSWQTEGEKVEAMTDFIFLGSKSNADGDCSHEIKRHLLLGRKAISNINWSEVKSLIRVRLFATPRAITYQAPLSMGFSRQEYWSGLPLPSPEHLPNPEIKPGLRHCRKTLYRLSHQGSHDKHREHIKKQRHHFADKGVYSQSMVFPVVMYRCESWAAKKAENSRIDAFKS